MIFHEIRFFLTKNIILPQCANISSKLTFIASLHKKVLLNGNDIWSWDQKTTNVILQLATWLCLSPLAFPNFLFGCPFQLSEWQNKWPENCVPHLHCIQLCTWHHRSSKRDRITRRFFESFMSFYGSQTPSHYSLILLSTLFFKTKKS